MEVDAQVRENTLESAPRGYIHSLHTAVTMYNQFGPLMDEFDCFVCPTLMTTGIPAEFTWPESEVDFNGTRRMVCEEQWNSTFLFNMLSRCPAAWRLMPCPGPSRSSRAVMMINTFSTRHWPMNRPVISPLINSMPASLPETEYAHRFQRKTRPAQ